MSTPTPEDLAAVIELLPDSYAKYGWSLSKALERWSGTVYRTVREYWLDRSNETAGYVNIEGIPASSIHTQAKEMLKYWDDMISKSEEESEKILNGSSRTRRAKRV